MRTKLLIFVLILLVAPAFSQQEQETLFRNARLSGGFGGPMFSWSNTNNQVGYGSGGGGGLVFNRFFLGLFGMGETLDNPTSGKDQLVIGYGGLWMGYTIPSHKLVHAYASLKLGGGNVAITDFRDDWDIEDSWYDATFVAVPEVGLELNIARWMRLSGTVGYRWVQGFDGWQSYDKNAMNAPVYGLTLRFGKFGKRHVATPVPR